MEGLYSVNRAQFHQLTTHIAVYHEDASDGARSLAHDCLQRAGLQPKKFTMWNVPAMAPLLGKSIPVDVHGRHVLIDEGGLKSAPGVAYGSVRFALLAAAIRAKAGGRWRYDFSTMNAAILAGCICGGGFLRFGRRRFSWMQRRPFLSIAASCGVALVALGFTRVMMKTAGVGLAMAERGHRRAMERLECGDCLDDVHVFLSEQLREVRQQELPSPIPGMPPVSPAQIALFERSKASQVRLLEVDLEELRVATKQSRANSCEWHRLLRADLRAEALSTQLITMPILPLDRELAAKRNQLSGSS